MNIGEKIKQLRIKNVLTQEELGARTELSKGFISQLERDLTSPSIATLVDILDALGTDLEHFFSDTTEKNVVYSSDDIFVKHDDENAIEIRWLVTNAQGNAMEPILVTIENGGVALDQDAHDGEEFGYILSGNVTLELGSKKFKAKKGDSFYFKPTSSHCIKNYGKLPAKVLWVSTPPSF